MDEEIVIAVKTISKQNLIRIGFALIDFNEFVLKICEFDDDLNFTFLESAILQTTPKKCLYQFNSKQQNLEKRLKSILDTQNCVFSEGSGAEFKDAIDASDLQRVLRPPSQARFLDRTVQELLIGRAALGAALRHAKVSLVGSSIGHFGFDILNVRSFLRLDSAAFSALQLMPESGARSRSGTSLFGFLNKTRTLFGQQKLMSWIRQPSTDKKIVEKRLSAVQFFIEHPTLTHALQSNIFRRFPNLKVLCYKLQKAAMSDSCLKEAELQDVALLNDALVNVHSVVALLQQEFGTLQESTIEQTDKEIFGTNYAFPLFRAVERAARFHDLVNYTVDMDEWRSGGRSAKINCDFTEELSELAAKRKACLDKIERHRVQVEQELGLPAPQSVKLIEGGSAMTLAFRVTKKDQHPVMAELIFTTKKLYSYLAEFDEVNSLIDKASKEFAEKTILTASTYCPVLLEITEILAEFDVLLGFAELASGGGRAQKDFLIRPIIKDFNEPRVILLEENRHVLVEHQLELQKHLGGSAQTFVPNSLHLKAPDRRLNIITGPNMGGKSTFIRQVAQTVVMAQIGSFIPCRGSGVVSLCDAIFCRVGASDDQLRGVSTFLAEMIEASAILSGATERSLVLIDELGRGTSSSEGLALAFEVAKYLATEIKCFTLFATHFHELGAASFLTEGIFASRAEMKLIENKINFLFSIEPGVADVSCGIKVAEIAGLPERVIERATKRIEEDQQTLQKNFSKIRETKSTEDAKRERLIRAIKALQECMRVGSCNLRQSVKENLVLFRDVL